MGDTVISSSYGIAFLFSTCVPFSMTCAEGLKWMSFSQLKDFFALKELKVRSDILEGTIKGLHGSAVQLVEHLYELFTGKRVQQMPEIETKESNEGSVRIFMRDSAPR